MSGATGNGPFERYLRLYGIVLDSLKTEIERLLDNYDVPFVQAGLIPYIDALIGWETNFDLPEGKRRRETLNAVALYQQKGRSSAVEAFIENIADWNVTIHEGWKYVFFLNDPRCLLPITSTVPGGLIDTPDDELKYLPTQNNWHCLNGVLIELEPVTSVTDELTATTIKKIDRLAPTLMTSWANINILLSTDVFTETIPVPSEDIVDVLDIAEDTPPPGEFVTSLWGSGILLMVLNEPTRTLNTGTVRMHHADIGYAGTAPPAPYP